MRLNACVFQTCPAVLPALADTPVPGAAHRPPSVVRRIFPLSCNHWFSHHGPLFAHYRADRWNHG